MTHKMEFSDFGLKKRLDRQSCVEFYSVSIANSDGFQAQCPNNL